MAASFPTSVKSFSTKLAAQTIAAAHVNDLQDEVVAVEGNLINGLANGLKPSVAGAQDLGTALLPWGTLRARAIQLDPVASLTISGGIVTVTKSHHSIDTESAAASDDLDTLTATGLTDGFVIVLRPANVAHVVTLKDGTGNLLLNGDYALSATDRTITLIYDGTNWRELARSVTTVAGSVVVLNKSTTEQDVTNTSSATDVYDYTMPANTLGTSGALRLVATGDADNGSGGGVNLTIAVAFGGTTIYSAAVTTVANAAAKMSWEIESLITANGATNSQRALTKVILGANGANSDAGSQAVASNLRGVHSALAIDTTASVHIKVTLTWASAVSTLHARAWLRSVELIS